MLCRELSKGRKTERRAVASLEQEERNRFFTLKEHTGLEKKPKPDDAADALAAAITCSFLYREGPTKQGYQFSNSRKKVL